MARTQSTRRNLALTAFALQLSVACQEVEVEGDASVVPMPDSGAADSSDPCRTQCSWAVGAFACDEKPFESFPDLEATFAEWQAACDPASQTGYPFLIEARCAEGTRLLLTGSGLVGGQRYFDAQGKFLAVKSVSDVGPGPPCRETTTYWPERIVCTNAKVVRVGCGTVFEVGDQVAP